jgi:hypothetical protein
MILRDVWDAIRRTFLHLTISPLFDHFPRYPPAQIIVPFVPNPRDSRWIKGFFGTLPGQAGRIPGLQQAFRDRHQQTARSIRLPIPPDWYPISRLAVPPPSQTATSPGTLRLPPCPHSGAIGVR